MFKLREPYATRVHRYDHGSGVQGWAETVLHDIMREGGEVVFSTEDPGLAQSICDVLNSYRDESAEAIIAGFGRPAISQYLAKNRDGSGTVWAPSRSVA